MQREIKFRAWDKENEEMLEVEDLHWDYTTGEFLIRTTMYSDYFNTDEMALMQYTGLKDKNGLEIYEGDILENPYSDDRATVEWSEEDGMFVLIIDDVETNFSNEKSTDWEVMGNIYDI